MTIVQDRRATPHTPAGGSQRPPWQMWGLALLTLGVYAAVRHYQVNRELRDFGIEVDPLEALLAFFPGVLVVVPYLVTNYRTGERIAVAQETAGLSPTARPELSTLGSIFALTSVPYQQTQLNRAWQADAEGELR